MKDLDDFNIVIREKAARDLEDIKYDLKHLDQNQLKNLVPKLIEKLDDPSGKVRRYTAYVLESISTTFPELFKDKITELMKKLDKPCEKPYRIYDRESHDEIYFPNYCQHARSWIAQTLENISKKFPELFKDKIPKLIELLDDSNDEVCATTGFIFKNIGRKYPELVKDAIPRLLRNVEAPSDVCFGAVEALLQIAEKYAEEIKDKIDVLMEKLEWLTSDDDAIYEDIADILHIIWKKYPSLVEEAMKNLWEDLDVYKTRAISAVAYKHPELVINTIPKLKEALSGKDESIRDSVVAALGNIGVRYPQLIKDIIPKLTELLVDENPDVCEVTYNVLVDLVDKHPEIVENIIPKLKEITFRVITETDLFNKYNLEDLTYFLKKTIIERHPKIIEDTIPKLIEKLDDPNEETRRRTIWLLGEIGEKKPELVKNAIQNLKEKLNNISIEVRQQATKTLQKIDQNIQK